METELAHALRLMLEAHGGSENSVYGGLCQREECLISRKVIAEYDRRKAQLA